MPSHRMGRTTEDIRRELTAIFRELKDPRVQGLISIVRVDVSSDLSDCTVYISAMEGMEHAKQATQGLKSAAGSWASGCACAMCRRCTLRRRTPSNTAQTFRKF